jgi:type IV pilus assembly protein PilW
MAYSMENLRLAAGKTRGFSLVEVMVAITIGLLLLTGMTLIFVNSSEANRELQKTARQIENGRYAIAMISEDLRHAGFYGHLTAMPAAPAVLPDPCEIASTANLVDALAYPVQGYRTPDLATVADMSASTCDNKNLLTAANLKPGSDVLVIRRAATTNLAPTDVAALNEVYIQANAALAQVRFGNGTTLGISNASNNGSGGPSTLLLKDATTPSPIRKLNVHVYFVAPCSVGTGANGICQAGDDDISTLKRLELLAEAGTTKMKLVPLVEGIEYLKMEYGVDTSPNVPNAATGVIGDATVDAYTATPADWTTVIAAKVFVLSRNTEPTTGFLDDKRYALGTVAVPAFNDRFKRHVYSTQVHLMNPAGRREIP